MSIRLALFPMLLLGLWSCGEDDPPPVAPGPGATVLRPSGELQPWDLSAIVSIDSVRSQPEGMPVYLRTEFASGQLADLEMTFVQVVDDLLPPMPLIMVEASDPVLIQLGGIAQGMSGSPLFSEEGTWGAIAYGFSSQDSPPYYFFATPIEWVIGEQSWPLAKPAGTYSDVVPLEIPIAVTGRGLSPWAQSVPAALTQDRQESFEAGRPLAVAMILGEVTGAGLGTISYVSGSRVYGFGHPMNAVGPVQLPIIEAKVLGEVSSLFAPFMFATLNPTIRGTLTEDRLPAVRGVLGESPELATIRSSYDIGGRAFELEHQAPPSHAANLVSVAVFRPLVSRTENEPGHSLRVTTEISFDNTDSTLSRSRLYAEPEGRTHSLVSLAEDNVAAPLSQLASLDDVALRVQEAEIHVEVIPENRYAKIVGVVADTVVAAGEDLVVTVLLRVGREVDREIEMILGLPGDLRDRGYLLEVGSASSLGDVDVMTTMEVFDVIFTNRDEEETLESIFSRENRPDENVVLKAQIIVDSADPMSTVPLEAPIFTQKQVDFYLEGTQRLEIEVHK